MDKKDKQFLKTVFLTRLLLALSVLGLFDFGFFQDFLMQRGDKVRHSFGFGHPNSLGMYLVVLFIDYFLMIGQKNVSKLTYLVCLGISLLVFAATDSRLGFLASLLVLLVGAFKERLTKYQIKGILLWLGIVLLYLLGIFLSYSYKENSDFYQNLNTLFSNRLLNAYNYIQAYGFHLWPNDYPPLYYGQTMVYNENFYIDTLLKNGLLLYLLYPILMFMQLKNKVVNLYPACLMLLCFLFAMVEDYEASVLMATPLLFNYFAEEKDELHSQSELEI
ncbi:O-antigen ligase family protein [Streptococcus loxodontisalivarius]|uniref:Membrane protein n=1 Tax=Streptococcus loxodontisalivarius TaxID=1349415 RepID=A0ABS2PT05_9STRE|nr:hypothetical protein [Streptococcus loxodontisalivarius]MBM7643172.1 putative membrane protein [Streptococcus loxodontisalivarius]